MMNDLTKPDSMAQSNNANWPKLPEIPRARYVDESFFQQEIEQIFKKTWLQVAHISEFEMEGSYRTIDLPLIAPIIIVRGKDGELRAFINSCRHRGVKVLSEAQGCARVMSCQYHSWTYDLKGKLVGVPGEEGFPGLVKEDHPLKSIRCERWGGFVFINLDANASPLLEWLGPHVRLYSEVMEAPLRIVSRQSVELECNWKLATEAFREIYHLDTVHHNSAGVSLRTGTDAFHEFYPHGHNTMFNPYKPDFLENMESGFSVLRAALGQLPGIEGKKFHDNVVTPTFFPNFLLSIQHSGMPQVIFWPLAKDRCRVEWLWYGMDWGTGPKPAEWEAVFPTFNMLQAEDFAVLGCIQGSIEATADDSVVLSDKMERALYELHAEIDRLIGEENIPQELRVPDIKREFITT